MVRSDQGWALERTGSHVFLVRWDENYEELLPDLAEEWEFSEDAREAVFKLREGVKWSDGEPFTAEDVVFSVNDVSQHPELVGGMGQTVVAEDDYTVRFTLDEPNGLFLHSAAGPSSPLAARPKHYLSQFHIDYNADANELAEEEGLDDWIALMEQKGGLHSGDRLNNAELPMLSAWQMSEVPRGSGTVLRLERNPYFWKVDPDGRQLPYIDELEMSIIDDEEVMLTAAANGEIDMQNRNINLPRNKPVLADERENSDFEFYDTTLTFMNTAIISLNLNSKEEPLRETFQKRDSGIGRSNAINRQPITATVS